MNFVTGSCVNTGILSGSKEDNGGYKVHPTVKLHENVFMKIVNKITIAKPITISIQFGSVRRNELRNSLMK